MQKGIWCHLLTYIQANAHKNKINTSKLKKEVICSSANLLKQKATQLLFMTRGEKGDLTFRRQRNFQRIVNYSCLNFNQGDSTYIHTCQNSLYNTVQNDKNIYLYSSYT